MVKVQKPIPKKLGNKPKLDNPIKKKKQQVQKGKSTGTTKNVKTKLQEIPIQESKIPNKSVKEVLKKSSVVDKNKNTQNGTGKLDKPNKPVSKKQTEQSKTVKKVKTFNVKLPAPAENATIKAAPPAKVIAPVNAKPTLQKSVKTAPAQNATVKVAPPAKVIAPVNAKPTFQKSVKAPATVKVAPPAKVIAPVNAKPILKKSVKAAAEKKTAATKKVIPTSQSKLELPAKGPIAAQKSKGKKMKKIATPDSPPSEQPKVEKKIAQLQEKKKRKIAFKKAKLNSTKTEGKKEKKAQRVLESKQYEPIPFEEEKFNAIVNKENIKKVAEALKVQVEKEVATKKSSIFDDYRYFLQVGSFKIANCPKRMVKLKLKHALVDKDDDVLLVVPDLQRGSKVDYEPTKHHYEDLLSSHGVEGITVMPMNQLRKEYSTFEQKRRLCASYDHFLCDGRIVSHVVGIIGRTGQKPRHTFHAVRLNVEKNIKNEIEKSLRKTAFRQLAKSSLHSIPVGSHKFTSQQLTENVEKVVRQLKTVFPGGLSNIRNLYLKIDITGTSALPLYISMAQAPEQTPQVVGTREEKMIKLKREANKVLSKFAMNKEGMLIKLSKAVVEKKRKAQELRALLTEEEVVSAKKAKKAKKEDANQEKKAKEANDLELPESEEDDDDTGDDEDDDDAVRLGGGSDDEGEDSDEMSDIEQVEDDNSDAEEEAGIVENGLGDDAEEEDSEAEEQQEVGGSDDDGDDDDDDEDEENVEDDDDEEEESD